jgi:hypothetical protein
MVPGLADVFEWYTTEPGKQRKYAALWSGAASGPMEFAFVAYRARIPTIGSRQEALPVPVSNRFFFPKSVHAFACIHIVYGLTHGFSGIRFG